LSRKKKKPDGPPVDGRDSETKLADKPAVLSAIPEPASTDQKNGTPARVLTALTLAVVWYVVLISMATTTANPIMLNAAQIKESFAIVLADVNADCQISIKKCWKTQLDEKTIQLSHFKFASGEKYPPGEYVIPLSRTRSGYEITESKVKNNSRLVYPSSKGLIESLEKFLK